MPQGHDDLKEQEGWATRALKAEADVQRLVRDRKVLVDRIGLLNRALEDSRRREAA